MATKTKAQTPAPIDFASLKRANRTYEWHEMPKKDGLEGEPLRVKLQRLSLPELEAIPAGEGVLMKDAIAEARDYIVAWNVTVETDDGVIAVPPPAELDNVAHVVERLLAYEELLWLYQRLKYGHVLKVAEAKKASRPSSDTPASSNGHDSAAES